MAKRRGLPTGLKMGKSLQEQQKDRVIQIHKSKLKHDKNQPRREFRNIENLKTSIEEKGVLQPLTVVNDGGDEYRVVLGGRRLEAAFRSEKIQVLPCIVRGEIDSSEIREMQLIENLQREDLNPIEETQGILDLLDLKMKDVDGYSDYKKGPPSVLNTMLNYEKGYSTHNVVGKLREIVESTFETVSISWKTFLNHWIPLLSLPDDLKEALINETNFKPTHAMEIGKIQDQEARGKLIQEVILNRMGLRELKQVVSEYQKNSGEGAKVAEPKKKKEFLTFDEIPNLKVKPRKNRFTLDIDLEKGDLLDTLNHLVDLVKQGRLEPYLS